MNRSLLHWLMVSEPGHLIAWDFARVSSAFLWRILILCTPWWSPGRLHQIYYRTSQCQCCTVTWVTKKSHLFTLSHFRLETEAQVVKWCAQCQSDRAADLRLNPESWSNALYWYCLAFDQFLRLYQGKQYCNISLEGHKIQWKQKTWLLTLLDSLLAMWSWKSFNISQPWFIYLLEECCLVEI